MRPSRLSLHIPATRSAEDLSPLIATFHRFIQRGLVEGLVIDVADYRHVPDGPGVLLVGHDVDYGINQQGLTVLRKNTGSDAAAQLRDSLRMALAFLDEVAEDGTFAADYDRSTFSVKAIDRRLGPAAEAVSVLRDAVAPVLADLFGDGVTLRDAGSKDARDAPVVGVSLSQPAGAEVLAKLGGSQAPGQSPWDISVHEFAALRESKAEIVVLDVREESEVAIATLGGTLIPLASLGDRLSELDKQAHIVVHCRSGFRGGTAIRQLREAGFDDAWHLNGGLMAWADSYDPAMQRY